MKIKATYKNGGIMIAPENEDDVKMIEALIQLTDVNVGPLRTENKSFVIEQVEIISALGTKVEISKTKNGLEWAEGI